MLIANIIAAAVAVDRRVRKLRKRMAARREITRLKRKISRKARPR